VSNGFISGQGSFTSVVGQSVSYSTSAVSSGVIIRTGTTADIFLNFINISIFM